MVARTLKQDKDGITVLITQKEYDAYMKELEEWLENNQDKVIEHPIEKCVTQFVICEKYPEDLNE
jgi:hypothetical protein